jgi:hypothetical protein
VKKAFLILLICYGAYASYQRWALHRAVDRYVASHPEGLAARPPSPAGFVDTLLPENVNPEVMTVFMPKNCPLDAGIRGRALIAKMKAAGIPLATSDRAQIQINARDRIEFEAKKKLLARSAEVMGSETPIVFFKGRAKANPTFEEVELEYQTGK